MPVCMCASIYVMCILLSNTAFRLAEWLNAQSDSSVASAEVIPAPKMARSPLLYLFIGLGVLFLLLVIAAVVVAVIVYHRRQTENRAHGYTRFDDSKDLYTHTLTNPTMEKAFLPQYYAL